MARFQKDKQKLGYRTPAPKIPVRPQKAWLAARRLRYIQHKG